MEDTPSNPQRQYMTTRENTNYARLCRLLIDKGTEALRDIFNGIHSPANLNKILLSSSPHYAKLKWLRERKILNPAQWKKLFTASSAEFDITLLMVLLRNICGLHPPDSTSDWDELPPDSDNTTEANLVRIKFYRNDVYAHASKASVDDSTFDELWENISNAIVGLACGTKATSYATAIGILRTESMDPDAEARYRDLLNDWKKYDDNMREMLEELKGEQERHEEEIVELRGEQERHEEDITELRGKHERAEEEIVEMRECLKRTLNALLERREIGDQDENGTGYFTSPVRYRQSTCGYQKPLLEHHEKRIKIEIEASDQDGRRTTYGSYTFSDKSVADHRKAIEYSEKHLKIATETNDRVGQGRAYENLGKAHQSLGDYQKAIEYHDKHLEIATETDDRVGQGRAYENLGKAHQSLGDLKSH
ncbi:PREDICTED: tetratricopeptide repeat protein 28-like isoform X2 [Acropora digitifera]|uniref:tetratricopeptide repeat protein 28-like isoform X2 n=1 Tax=Acropora digitifera TaxID=70779 RepID=UPI00077B02C7|nr:PREDICTED: tetratricopeptide repeat protein 28-like isoform X2 [Acropora digitifera]